MSCLKEIVSLIKEVLSVPNYFRLCPNMKFLILCLDENQIKIVNIVMFQLVITVTLTSLAEQVKFG